MSDTILSKVLETIESQSLPEGEYLQICSLVKECHIQLTNKETWIQVTKPVSNRVGMDFYNTNRKCVSIDIKRAELWERNDKAENTYVKKPSDTYIFEVTFYKNIPLIEESPKKIEIKKTLDGIIHYIKSIMSIYRINKYEIFYDDFPLECCNLYPWISETKTKLKKINELNGYDCEDDDPEDDLGDDNFIHFMANEMRKLVELI